MAKSKGSPKAARRVVDESKPKSRVDLGHGGGKSAIGLPELSVWKAEVVRVTVFPEPTPSAEMEGWWSSVTGEPPETRNSQPRLGVIQESGAFLDGVLTLNVTPLRVDWLLSVSTSPSESESGLPVLGDLTKIVESFCSRLDAWFNLAPPVKRLAFGCVGSQQVAGHKEGYELLGKYLPGVTVDPEGSSEFLYQINRPRPSTVIDGLIVNRLTKWSAARTQSVSMQLVLTPDAEGSVVSGVPMGEFFAVRSELDINTSPKWAKPFAKRQLASILGELVGLGLEIAAKGDIP